MSKRFKEVWINDLFEMKGLTFRKVSENEIISVVHASKTLPVELGFKMKIRNKGVFVSYATHDDMKDPFRLPFETLCHPTPMNESERVARTLGEWDNGK